MKMLTHAMIDIQNIESVNPISQLGFEKDKSHIHILVNTFKIDIKKSQGTLSSAKIVKKHEIHKKRINNGVKIRLEIKLMYEMGSPHRIKIGIDIKVITN